MRKLFLILFLFLMLTSFVLAKDVAYVVKNDVFGVDQNIIDELIVGGYTYDVIDDSDISSTDFSNYELILVKDKLSNAPINDYKSLVINPDYYEDWSSDIGNIGSNQNLEAMNNQGRSIGEGLPSVFEVYNDCCFSGGSVSIPMYYLAGAKFGSEGTIYTVNHLGEFAVATKENPRRIFFGITETDYWNSNSELLFRNSIQWLIEGEDRDGDGFFSGEDCDDIDPNVNPNGVEIPYDGIDQDCDGSDFADRDGDGYDSDLAGGNDCNDDNSGINPGAVEIIDNIDQNCVNDAPVIIEENIPEILWNEDELSYLLVGTSIVDPEGDVLTFSVDSSSTDDQITLELEENTGVVALSSGQDWNGAGWVIFDVSDGQVSTKTQRIDLRVLPINDAPVLDEIDDLYVLEGDLATITPTATDIESDTLTFSFSSPFNSNGDWQTDSGGIGTTSTTVSVSDGNGGFDSQQVVVNVIRKIIINEVESNPEGEDSGNEWVELINPSGQETDISGYVLKDVDGNEFPLSGTINEYFVHSFSSSVLKNTGEQVTLYNGDLIVDGTLVFDDSSNDLDTWGRLSNWWLQQYHV